MKNIVKLSLITLLVFIMGACVNTELEELLDNPNSVTADNAELDLVYNNVVLEFVELVDELSDETMPYVRMAAMSGGFQYNNQDSPPDFDFLWGKCYSELVPDIDLVLELAKDEDGNVQFTVHSGSAKVMKAYILFSLVDLFGDVPYSEAFQGVSNPSPAADDDESVYNAALALLDEAITELQSPVGRPANDLYYGGSGARWLTLARTLKLRYYVQTRLVNGGSAAGISQILGTGDIIDQISEDWQFQYGSNRQTPDSRHPYYSDGYENGGPGWYMSNYYMWQFFGEKETEDPRLRYYFRRQDAFEDNENQFTLDCITAPYPLHWPDGYPWCTASLERGDPDGEYGGYWGRAHGNADGIPPDDLKRTAWGLYPCGGAFDNLPKIDPDEAESDNAWQVSNGGTDGARGAGIQPIWLSSWTHFLLAEVELMMNNDAEKAGTLLEAGVRQSITKVMNFAPGQVDQQYAPGSDQVEAYVAEVMDLYNNAGNTTARLRVVMNEFRLAAHGMGLDIFNAYRRTGQPSGMQPTREANPGSFPRTMWYPASYVNRNANASQRSDLTTQVFWDNNPASGWID